MPWIQLGLAFVTHYTSAHSHLPPPVILFPRNGDEILAQPAPAESSNTFEAKFSMRLQPHAWVVTEYDCRYELIISPSSEIVDGDRIRTAKSEELIAIGSAGTFFLAARYSCLDHKLGHRVVGPDAWLVVDVVPANAPRVYPAVSAVPWRKYTCPLPDRPSAMKNICSSMMHNALCVQGEPDLNIASLRRRARILFVGDMAPSKLKCSVCVCM
jgi:hypothetical protein